MKQSDSLAVQSGSRRGQKTDVSDFIWETFDSLFKTVHRQGRRLEELEARVVDLESRLAERQTSQQPKALQPAPVLPEMPVERAA